VVFTETSDGISIDLSISDQECQWEELQKLSELM
jgi:hypothetical protein